MQFFTKRIVKHSLRDRFLSEEVLKYISIKERFVLSSVCKLWNEICQNPCIFKNTDLRLDFGNDEFPMRFIYTEDDDTDHHIDCSSMSESQLQSVLSICQCLEYGIYITESDDIPDLPILPNVRKMHLQTPIKMKHLTRLRQMCMQIHKLLLGEETRCCDPILGFLPTLNSVSLLFNYGDDLRNLAEICPHLTGLGIIDHDIALDNKVITKNIANLLIEIDFPVESFIPDLPTSLPSIKILFLAVRVNVDEISEVVERAKTWINALIQSCENLEHIYICQEEDNDDDSFDDEFKYVSLENISLPLTIVEDGAQMENLFDATCRQERF